MTDIQSDAVLSREILSFNNTLAEQQADICTLEMCHYNFPKITGLGAYISLSRLFIIAQDINVICGLDAAPQLSQLWICECKVTKIEGLAKMVNLTKLLLYRCVLT